MTNSIVPANGCHIYLTAKGCPTLRVPVTSFQQASAVWSKYRDDNGLGASDMKRGCGNVCGNDGTVIARISYNGRSWDLEGNLIEDSASVS